MKAILFVLIIISTLFFFAGTNDGIGYYNYANQAIPNYINRDNTPVNNQLNDTIATLGRVLFYDKKLSANNTISCANCHQQAFAFGDSATLSQGLSQGLTERHAMRLVNIRFGEGTTLFWNERTTSLETQTTQPIRDHLEMGFSGKDGAPTFEALISKLENIDYYESLFSTAFGDKQISEIRIQFALAQFIRSIQSFDAKYDKGRAQVSNDNVPFPNFTELENEGKRLFMMPKDENGANCQPCHRAPIFDIDPGTSNNGIIGVANDPTAFDLMNNRSPTLRDLVNLDGKLNGPLMHDGSLTSLAAVIDHYNKVPLHPINSARLNSRLRTANRQKGQDLQLTPTEKDALIAFLKTLTGTAVYTDERWSTPFNKEGELIF